MAGCSVVIALVSDKDVVEFSCLSCLANGKGFFTTPILEEDGGTEKELDDSMCSNLVHSGCDGILLP